jgi:hypothetical protein
VPHPAQLRDEQEVASAYADLTLASNW